jgi:hypothetical protein
LELHYVVRIVTAFKDRALDVEVDRAPLKTERLRDDTVPGRHHDAIEITGQIPPIFVAVEKHGGMDLFVDLPFPGPGPMAPDSDVAQIPGEGGPATRAVDDQAVERRGGTRGKPKRSKYAAGVIPIIKVFMEKGMAMGTALAFMKAVTGLSFPEAIILRKVLKPKLLAVFFGVAAAAIVITGYLFNLVL